MLLAIDIGNTNVALGLYDGAELRATFRLESDMQRTVDEYALSVLSLLEHDGVKRNEIHRVVLCCVVPALLRVFSKLSQKYFRIEPFVVSPSSKLGIEINVDDPRTVGADRLVNALAVRELFGCPAVVIDFGTATTFDIVSAEGSYDGGIIAPGLLISAEALFVRTALLPRIQLTNPKTLVGKNTEDSMLSGIVFGYAELVDGLVRRLARERGELKTVIATGGLARVVSEHSKTIHQVVPDLTLRGLKLIADRNQ